MKIALGILLAFAIGVLCRMTGVPSPAPPALIGALLVLAMSLGYVVTDQYARHRPSKHRALGGGPSGETARHSERTP